MRLRRHRRPVPLALVHDAERCDARRDQPRRRGVDHRPRSPGRAGRRPDRSSPTATTRLPEQTSTTSTSDPTDIAGSGYAEASEPEPDPPHSTEPTPPDARRAAPKQAQGASRPCRCSPPMPRSGPALRWSRPMASTTSNTAGRARCGGTGGGSVRLLPAGPLRRWGCGRNGWEKAALSALNVFGRKVRVNVVSAQPAPRPPTSSQPPRPSVALPRGCFPASLGPGAPPPGPPGVLPQRCPARAARGAPLLLDGERHRRPERMPGTSRPEGSDEAPQLRRTTTMMMTTTYRAHGSGSTQVSRS